MNSLLIRLRSQPREVNWLLLVVLLLLLNVKLVIKLAAFAILLVSKHRKIDWKNILNQKHLRFYFLVIIIAGINFLLASNFGLPKLVSTTLGMMLWFACLFAAYFLFSIVKQEKLDKLYNTVALFFILHFSMIFFNLARIMVECGTLNPYTFRGFHQKYYISTGDFISGITFDSPVTTAVISAFGVLYFLYRRQFLLSILSMCGLVLIASNLTNLLLVLTLLFLFVFKTDKVQKSIVVALILVIIVFTGKISPQNNEYTGRFAYKMLGLTYDKPKSHIIPEFIRKQPDSLLSLIEQKKKLALLFIDSISAVRAQVNFSGKDSSAIAETELPDKKALKHAGTKPIADTFRETPTVIAKVNRYRDFLDANYTPKEKESLEQSINSSQPGKWIAIKQVVEYFKTHPRKMLLGNGMGNFSSRLAFKTAALGIAGGYPEKYRHIHPDFLQNHLHLYLYYHAQDQPKHAAENTPDSTYGQLLSEYGIVGLAGFLLLYLGYYTKKLRKLSFAPAILLMLAGILFTEYWFEQLSIIVLAELLFFIDMKAGPVKKVAE